MRNKEIREKHPLADKSVILKSNGELNGKVFVVEDWCCNLSGFRCFQGCPGNNFACAKYALRESKDKLPDDDEVIYGKIDNLGHIVHVSELGKVVKKPTKKRLLDLLSFR